MAKDSGGWLAVLAEAEAIRWVLKNEQMAFSKGLRSRARKIREGDRIILYAARGAWHNPTRDRSQLIALAEVASEVRDFPRPISVAGREFVSGMRLKIHRSLPFRQGLPVEPLVDRLDFVKRPEVWGQYVRSGLVRLNDHDVGVLSKAMGAVR